MRSEIMRSFFSHSPPVNRVGGSNGGRLGQKIEYKRKRE